MREDERDRFFEWDLDLEDLPYDVDDVSLEDGLEADGDPLDGELGSRVTEAFADVALDPTASERVLANLLAHQAEFGRAQVAEPQSSESHAASQPGQPSAAELLATESAAVKDRGAVLTADKAARGTAEPLGSVDGQVDAAAVLAQAAADVDAQQGTAPEGRHAGHRHLKLVESGPDDAHEGAERRHGTAPARHAAQAEADRVYLPRAEADSSSAEGLRLDESRGQGQIEESRPKTSDKGKGQTEDSQPEAGHGKGQDQAGEPQPEAGNDKGEDDKPHTIVRLRDVRRRRRQQILLPIAAGLLVMVGGTLAYTLAGPRLAGQSAEKVASEASQADEAADVDGTSLSNAAPEGSEPTSAPGEAQRADESSEPVSDDADGGVAYESAFIGGAPVDAAAEGRASADEPEEAESKEDAAKLEDGKAEEAVSDEAAKAKEPKAEEQESESAEAEEPEAAEAEESAPVTGSGSGIASAQPANPDEPVELIPGRLGKHSYEEEAELREAAAAASVDPYDPEQSLVSSHTVVRMTSGTRLTTLVAEDAPQYVDESSVSLFVGFGRAKDDEGNMVDCEVFKTLSWVEYPYAVQYQGEAGYWLADLQDNPNAPTKGLVE